jgi:hypothetical protein
VVNAERQPDGSILAPKYAESSSGAPLTTGVGWVVLWPGMDGYDDWDRWLREGGDSSFAGRISRDIGRRRGLE